MVEADIFSACAWMEEMALKLGKEKRRILFFYPAFVLK